MKQNMQSGKRIDYGQRGESGEREPHIKDEGRHVGVPKEDRETGHKGLSGEHEPKGAKGRDSSGERSSGIVGGVGMGKADAHGRGSDGGKHDGRTGEFNTGTKEGSVYSHQRHKMGFTHK
jgi:hypothetical protein